MFASPLAPSDLLAARLHGWRALTLTKDQPQYNPLPVLRDTGSGAVVSRWSLTWRERLRVLFGGDIYVQSLTFNEPLQPLKLTVGLDLGMFARPASTEQE